MYYIIYGLLYAVSLLPLRVLYVLSDFVYFLLYYVFGYRKKVVMSNLLQAFPEKTHEEIKQAIFDAGPFRADIIAYLGRR